MIISKTIYSRTLLPLTSTNPTSPFPFSLIISHFSSSSLTPYTHVHSHSHPESRNVRVSVWWDFENCNLPTGVNVFRVAQAITAAVRANGIKGPIQITAFGDVLQLSRANQEALSSTGINLSHVPNGGKNSADRSLLIDLMHWVSQNPPPAHLFLISSDRDFASVLHRLRMTNYNILLATKDSASSVLCSAASIMWQWNSLLRGDNLTGRYFNQPPDGPYASWYGHYKVPLENPFAIVEQQTTVVERATCSEVEDTSGACSVTAVRPVPKAVIDKISHILSLHPNGMSITELRSRLATSNVAVDKSLYGYKKFSRFLLSMPRVVKLKCKGDGQYVVHRAAAKAPEPFQPCPGNSTATFMDNSNEDITKSAKTTDVNVPVAGPEDENFPLPSTTKQIVTESPTKAQVSHLMEKTVKMDTEQPPNKLEQPQNKETIEQLQQSEGIEQIPLVAEKAEMISEKVAEDNLPALQEQDSASEVGFFRKLWRRWFGSESDDSESKRDNIQVKSSGDSCENNSKKILEKSVPSGESPPEKEVEKKDVKSPQDDVPVHSTSCSSSTARSAALDDKTAIISEPHAETSRKSPSLLKRILSWCKFQRSGPYASGDQSSEVFEHINGSSGKPVIFSVDSFWRELESFISSTKGSLIILQSRTREQLAQNLQKEGPMVLQSLNENDVLKLVDLLISEKKWVEKCPSEASPFKLTCSVVKRTVGGSRAPNGLSSIFMSLPLQSDLQKRPGQDGDIKIQNIPHSGASSPYTDKNSERSRSDIIVDCQKLVNEVLKECPEGYYMGAFRKLFFERYGYHLDIKKLGYQKLASLLQIMPGVKIESNRILSCSEVADCSSKGRSVFNTGESKTTQKSAISDGELSDASKKDDEYDSPWEELGPVESTCSGEMEMGSVSRKRERVKTTRQSYPDYESPLSDDEFSDSEEEYGKATREGGQPKPGINTEDSSLLQILDSWYSSSKGDNGKDESDSLENIVDCSTEDDSSRRGIKIENSAGNYSRKQKPQKIYTFVAEPAGNNEDKLIGGILGSLKGPGESRMKSEVGHNS